MIGDTSRIWALAMNGERARILRSPGQDGAASIELVLRSDFRHLREIMSRKMPPSGRNSSNLIAEDQGDFIRQVIALLESHRLAGEFDHLVIFAEHRILANLRRLMPQSLRRMILREVPRDVLHLTPHALFKTISDELNNGTHAL